MDKWSFTFASVGSVRTATGVPDKSGENRRIAVEALIKLLCNTKTNIIRRASSCFAARANSASTIKLDLSSS